MSLLQEIREGENPRQWFSFLKATHTSSLSSIRVTLLDLAMSMDVNQAMRLSSQVIILFLNTKRD
jgi:hypothetical protein